MEASLVCLRIGRPERSLWLRVLDLRMSGLTCWIRGVGFGGRLLQMYPSKILTALTCSRSTHPYSRNANSTKDVLSLLYTSIQGFAYFHAYVDTGFWQGILGAYFEWLVSSVNAWGTPNILRKPRCYGKFDRFMRRLYRQWPVSRESIDHIAAPEVMYTFRPILAGLRSAMSHPRAEGFKGGPGYVRMNLYKLRSCSVLSDVFLLSSLSLPLWISSFDAYISSTSSSFLMITKWSPQEVLSISASLHHNDPWLSFTSRFHRWWTFDTAPGILGITPGVVWSMSPWTCEGDDLGKGK